MGFASAAALLLAGLSALALVAHFLRRRRAETRKFAPVALVPAAKPATRSRARLEDKGLLSARVGLVALLALVAAAPFVTCSRMTLSRGGASVAVVMVIDDSLSMRATYGTSKQSRLAHAREGMLEMVHALRGGDAVGVVLAGAEPRVTLSLTTDLVAAERAISGLLESDRGTDLRGALGLARSLLASTPHVDKRIVLVSDMADPSIEGTFDVRSENPVSVPMPELIQPSSDCAITAADRSGKNVHVRVVCTPGASPTGRELTIRAKDKVLAKAPAQRGDMTLGVSEDAPALTAVLSPGDALASDDQAMVTVATESNAVGIVADVTVESETSAHAPAVEQALRALRPGGEVRPLATLPERAAELGNLAGLIVDDPPGLTPEQRTALSQASERGLVLLLALGRRSAAPALGATFDPFLENAVRWGSDVPGAFKSTSDLRLAPMLEGLDELHARGRVLLSEPDMRRYETLVAWGDGAPFIARRAFGRGEVWLTTLPMRADESDLPLRTGFLAMLDAFSEEVKTRSQEVSGPVGRAWRFGENATVTVDGPRGPLAPVAREHALTFVPDVAGPYTVSIAGTKEARVATIPEDEMAFEPKTVVGANATGAAATAAPRLDVTWMVALALLFAFAIELGLRVWSLAHAPKEKEGTA